jgi:hypothetical protein
VLRECGIAQKYSAWAQVGARSQHYILWLEGCHSFAGEAKVFQHVADFGCGH